MNIVDLTPAIDAGDHEFVRRTFRALVDYPYEEEIVCGGAGHLICALDCVGKALAADHASMPSETCAVLEMPPGATYAQGAERAQEIRPDLVEKFRAARSRLLEA